MTSEEIRELRNQLRDCERERDKIAYMLVKAQDEIEGLEEQLLEARNETTQLKGQHETIREVLKPLVPRVPPDATTLTIVNAVANAVAARYEP